MNAAPKLAVFALILGAALAGGAVVGQAVGPIDGDRDDEPVDHDEHESSTGAAAPRATPDDEEQVMPAGVLISAEGYTIETDADVWEPESPEPLTFRIIGPDGSVVREFTASHERELHLILVGTDLASYAHLHPSRGEDGTWSVELPRLAPGVYRVFADFAVAGGPELTLGFDVAVPGDAAFAALPTPSATATVDGYEVTLTGAPTAGTTAEVALRVTKDGEPVTDLAPYLGAFGHLVAIRRGDLAYLHVHPLGDMVHDQSPRGGPVVEFAVNVPSPGDYRWFFDFSHDGQVHTAAFTVEVPTP